DWRAAADPEATLAIYMGAQAAAELATGLMAAGRDGGTPAVAVENAGRPEARLFSGTLGNLPGMLPAGLDGPVLIVVGETAAAAAGYSVSSADRPMRAAG